MLGTVLDVVARKLPFHDLGISVEGLVPERFHHLTKADFEKLKYKWKLDDVPTLFDFTVEVDQALRLAIFISYSPASRSLQQDMPEVHPAGILTREASR